MELRRFVKFGRRRTSANRLLRSPYFFEDTTLMCGTFLRRFSPGRRVLPVAVVLLLTIATTRGADTPAPTLANHTRWTTALAFSPDGKLLASVGGESLLYRPGDVRLWDAATGAQKAALDGHDSSVWSVAFSADGKTLATGAYDGTVKLWDVATGKEKESFAAHPHWVKGVAFVPTTGQLATAGEDGTVKLWDLSGDDPTEKQTLKGHAGAVNAVLFTPDGKQAITASDDKTIQVWDLAKGASTAKLESHTEPVAALAWLVPGKQFASAGEDRAIKVWNLAEVKPADTKPAAELPPQRNWVTGLVATPDGKQLIAAGYDRTLRLIDPTKKTETAVVDGFTTTVWCVALASDGKRLAAGGAFDSTGKIPSIRVWTLPGNKEAFPVERPASASGAKLNPPWKPGPPPGAPVAEATKPDDKKPADAKPAADKKPAEAKKPDEKKPVETKPAAKKPDAKPAAADAKPAAKTKDEPKKDEPKKPEAAKPKPAAPAAKKNDVKKDDAKKN
jgi:hypothetical protein